LPVLSLPQLANRPDCRAPQAVSAFERKKPQHQPALLYAPTHLCFAAAVPASIWLAKAGDTDPLRVLATLSRALSPVLFSSPLSAICYAIRHSERTRKQQPKMMNDNKEMERMIPRRLDIVCWSNKKVSAMMLLWTARAQAKGFVHHKLVFLREATQ
jgi:hypothetical protein